MNETSTSTVVVAPRQSQLPLILVVLLLLFLLPLSFLFSRWVLDQCLAQIEPVTVSSVLGVSNLMVTPDVAEAQAGGTVTFTFTGDHSEDITNGVITFNSSGKGILQTAPVGEGTCQKLSDTEATCTGVNAPADQELHYVVPILVDAGCGLVVGDNVGLGVNVIDQTLQNSAAAGSVPCAAITASSSSSSSSSSSGTSGTSSSGTSSGGTSSGGTSSSGTSSSSGIPDSAATANDDAVAACNTNATNAFLIAALLSLILILIVYVAATYATRRGY